MTWLFCCVAQVQAGPSSEPYLVFPTSYCECQAFQFDVLSKQELLLVSFLGCCVPGRERVLLCQAVLGSL